MAIGLELPNGKEYVWCARSYERTFKSTMPFKCEVLQPTLVHITPFISVKYWRQILVMSATMPNVIECYHLATTNRLFEHLTACQCLEAYD